MSYTKEEIDEALASASWKFAATMPNAPHSYSRRATWQNQKLFEAAVDWVREKGTPTRTKFGKRTWAYYMPGDGYKYWAGDRPGSQEHWINRASL